MSIPDEYEDLETRLRQSKPQAESLPPALKRQMRHELMEQMTMNDNRFSFRKLSIALGGLILLIGIPVFFWLAQMSIGAANNPDAASNLGQGLDPSRPTPTVAADVIAEGDEAPVVEEAVDRAWFVSSEPVEGETAGLHDTINVTVGYELVTVEEAELQVKLVDGPVGVLTAGKMVSGTSGTVVIPLSLAELEDRGESNSLQLQLLLRDPTPGVTKLLYLEFVEGWIMAAAEQTTATAEIIQISKPIPSGSEGGPPAGTNAAFVELTITYTLTGYEEAVLVAGYEFTDGNGTGGGHTVTPVSAGSGTVSETLALGKSFLNEMGEPAEGVRFFARINRYDEAAAQWVNLFPGNEPLLLSEQTLPYPYTVSVQSAVTAVTCRAIVNGTAASGLTLRETLTGEGVTTLPDGTVLVLLETEPAVVEGFTWRNVQTLDGEEGWVIEDFLTIGNCEFPDQMVENEIQLISYEVVTQTTEIGVAADITLMVSYNLSNEYTSGHITFSSLYSAAIPGGGNGGGGGGSEKVVMPGNGTVEFTFGFETASWATMQDWLDSMSISLLLFGNTTSGEELLVGEATQIGID
jgi:hypothetical protein